MEPVEINLGTYYLRALRADDRLDDRPALLEGFADPELRHWVPRFRIDDLADAGAYVTQRAGEWAADERYSWAVADPTTGELLGEVGLKELDLAAGTAEAYCWTHPNGRRRGMASQALGAVLRFGFGAVGLHRVTARYAEHNLASARVARKCGFRVVDQPDQVERGVLGDGTEALVVVVEVTPA